jgi:MoaA/NifB/PqqE/SkfB family radical SAM enzyme
MLTGIHFILTYTCNYECDHCFLYCSPRSTGTFTIDQVKIVLEEIKKIKSVSSVSFEGGESFLFYPLLLESVRLASRQGLSTAIETNTYWATSVEDARLWLMPLKEAGLQLLEVSDDAFHHGEEEDNSAKRARMAAEELGLQVNAISINPPEVSEEGTQTKGKPIYLGGPKMRGRAVDKLAKGLPTQSWENFIECPFEDLEDPERVHIDAFGNVHLCQGLSMGNIWEIPLSELIQIYRPDAHPVCGPLLEGGPAQLARSHNLSHKNIYVDACHMCTEMCRSLIDTYPDVITPRQVYGCNS